eukprot:Gb_28979 [translate_table: standard]
MIRASIKQKYEASVQVTIIRFVVTMGDLKLKETCTDAKFSNDQSMDGTLSLEAGFFRVDYDLPRKFEFMTFAKILGKSLKFTYIHGQKSNMIILHGI